MSLSFRPLFSRSQTGYIVCSLICLTVAVAVIRAHVRARYEPKPRELQEQTVPTSNPQPLGGTPSLVPSERLEAELITVRPTGFDPAEIRRPLGAFILMIENRSGTDLGPLRLEAVETGQPTPASRISQTRISKEMLNYGERLELPPGYYRLRQIENPGWSFTISISSR